MGKTYTILEFGHTNYENVAYFNFETNPKLKEINISLWREAIVEQIKKPLENYRNRFCYSAMLSSSLQKKESLQSMKDSFRYRYKL